MSWLLENTVVASCAALLVAGCVRLLKPRPAVAHALWACVLLILVVPPVVRVPVLPPAASGELFVSGAPVTVSNMTGPNVTAPNVTGPILTAPIAEAAGPARSSEPTHEPPRGLVTLPAVAATELAQSDREAAPWTMAQLLLGGWVTGSAFVGLLVGFGALRMRRRLRHGREADDVLRGEVREAARRLGVRAPSVRVVHGQPSPFIWAFGRATLVWPADYAAEDPARRVAVLSHELAHVRRHDHWIARLEILTAIALWWHPLFWLARSRMREHAELACDAWAVWSRPDDRHAYATALVDALETRSRGRLGLPALGARPSSRRAFERRLTMILHQDVPRGLTARAFAPIAMCAAMAFSGFTNAQDPEVRRETRQERRLEQAERRLELLQQKLERQLAELKREQAELDEAKRELAESRGDDRRQERRGRRLETRREREREEEPRRREGTPLPGFVRAMIQMGLAEAKAEIRQDEDLRRMGLTQSVESLIDTIAQHGPNSREFNSAIGDVVGRGLRAGLKEAKAEIRQDGELRELGLEGPILEMLDNLMESGAIDTEQFGGVVGKLVQEAMSEALDEAREEIRSDEDLRRLGLTGEVEKLIDTIENGGGVDSDAFASQLESLIEAGLKAGLNEARVELKAEGLDTEAIDSIEKMVRQAIQGDVESVEEFERSIEKLVREVQKRESESRRRR